MNVIQASYNNGTVRSISSLFLLYHSGYIQPHVVSIVQVDLRVGLYDGKNFSLLEYE